MVPGDVEHNPEQSDLLLEVGNTRIKARRLDDRSAGWVVDDADALADLIQVSQGEACARARLWAVSSAPARMQGTHIASPDS